MNAVQDAVARLIQSSIQRIEPARRAMASAVTVSISILDEVYEAAIPISRI